jgi:N-acetylglucosaminyl-diphospho-decaprenol L-rhamnosyltransferase
MELSRALFSAIVVSYQTGPILDACLEALVKAPFCSEVVLVNNGNPSEVRAKLLALAKSEPKFTLIDGHGNVGFGSASNLGAQVARNALLVFVNPDCILDETALPAFGEALAQHPNALIGGSLRNEDGSEQRGCRRGELTIWSAIISFLGLGRPGGEAGIWRDFNRTRESLPQTIIDMPAVSGALMAISASSFKKLGGFDPAYFLHVEDVDLCRRVRESGSAVLFAPDATALHVGATSATSSWVIEHAKIRSFARYFWKNARSFSAQLCVIFVMPLLAFALIFRTFLKRQS